MQSKHSATAGDILPSEILEQVFLQLPHHDLLAAKEAFAFWSAIIDQSPSLQRAMLFRPAQPNEYLLWQSTAAKPEWHPVITSAPVARSAGTTAPSDMASMVISEIHPALSVLNEKSLPGTYTELQVSDVDSANATSPATLLIQPPCFRCTVQRRRGWRGHETDVTNPTGVTILDVMLAASDLRVMIHDHKFPLEDTDAGHAAEGSAPIDEEPVLIFLDHQPADIVVRIPDYMIEGSEWVQNAREAAVLRK